MAALIVDGDDVVVRLNPLEKAGAMHGDVRSPLSAVRSVSIAHKPWTQMRGMRAPGTGIPRVIMLGTKRGPFGKDFCAVYGNRPAVIVELDGQLFQRLVVCTRRPEQDLAAIRRHAPQAA